MKKIKTLALSAVVLSVVGLPAWANGADDNLVWGRNLLADRSSSNSNAADITEKLKDYSRELEKERNSFKEKQERERQDYERRHTSSSEREAFKKKQNLELQEFLEDQRYDFERRRERLTGVRRDNSSSNSWNRDEENDREWGKHHYRDWDKLSDKEREEWRKRYHRDWDKLSDKEREEWRKKYGDRDREEWRKKHHRNWDKLSDKEREEWRKKHHRDWDKLSDKEREEWRKKRHSDWGKLSDKEREEWRKKHGDKERKDLHKNESRPNATPKPGKHHKLFTGDKSKDKHVKPTASPSPRPERKR